jgi:hypothetical protein
VGPLVSCCDGPSSSGWLSRAVRPVSEATTSSHPSVRPRRRGQPAGAGRAPRHIATCHVHAPPSRLRQPPYRRCHFPAGLLCRSSPWSGPAAPSPATSAPSASAPRRPQAGGQTAPFSPPRRPVGVALAGNSAARRLFFTPPSEPPL